MDLDTITGYRYARSRDDLLLGATERFVAGGTWMFSEPQLDATGLVDLTAMDWPALEVGDHGLRIGATCTIAELAAMPEHERWRAHPLFFQCATPCSRRSRSGTSPRSAGTSAVRSPRVR